MSSVTVLRRIHRRGYHLVVLAVLVLVALLWYHHASSDSHEEWNVTRSSSQKTLTDKGFFAPLEDKLYQQVTSRFQEVYLNDNTRGKTLRQDRIEKYLDLTDKSHTIKVPDHDQLPSLQPYDPRFTFGLLALFLSQSVDEITNDGITLPYFHWVDYVDVPDVFRNIKHKSTCEEMFPVPKSRDKKELKKLKLSKSERQKLKKLIASENLHTDPKHNCFNDDDIDAMIEERVNSTDPRDVKLVKQLQGFKDNKKYSMGWHVFQRTGHRMTPEHRSNMSQAYIYEYLESPLQMVMLLPSTDAGSVNKVPLKISIKQGEEALKTQLKDTPIFTALRQRTKDNEGNVYLDLAKEIRELSRLVLQKNTIKSSLETLIELEHDDFVDESAMYIEELEKLDPNSLDLMTKQYLDSLKFSLKKRRPPKYLYETLLVEGKRGSGSHYDWRFFQNSYFTGSSGNQSPIPIVNRDYDVLNNKYTMTTLQMHSLIRGWLAFTQTYGLRTWLAHGTLLGWLSTGFPFPWDNDYDVQMPIRDLHRLGREFNQTMVIDFGGEGDGEVKYGRFFIDVTSSLPQRNHDGKNNIDARFVDVDTGFYIDITGLAVSNATPKNKGAYVGLPVSVVGDTYTKNNYLKLYNCRNEHFANLTELSPLRLTTFQGYPAYIPNKFEKLIADEYRDYNKPFFSFHTYNPDGRMWLPASFLMDTQGPKKTFVDVNYEFFVKALLDNEDKLIEYVINSKNTLEHANEMSVLRKNEDYASQYLSDENHTYKGAFTSLLRCLFNYFTDITGKTFEQAMAQLKELLGE